MRFHAARNLRLFLVLVLAAAAGGCSTIRSGSHVDETADFSDYRSWSWIADDPHVAADEIPVSPLTHAKIREAISEQLRIKGYEFAAERESADFVVSYTVGRRDKLRVSSWPVAYRGPWGWHVAGSRYYVREYEEHVYTEGSLSVDVFDALSRQPVWHGWAEKSVTERDRQDPTEVIRDGVARLLEPFPRSTDADPATAGDRRLENPRP